MFKIFLTLLLVFLTLLSCGKNDKEPSKELKECAKEAEKELLDFGVHCGHLFKET